jgi:hypothetical protein
MESDNTDRSRAMEDLGLGVFSPAMLRVDAPRDHRTSTSWSHRWRGARRSASGRAATCAWYSIGTTTTGAARRWRTGSQIDDAAAAAGLYPDGRSNRGGSEPEVLDLTHYRGRDLVAVGLAV